MTYAKRVLCGRAFENLQIPCCYLSSQGQFVYANVTWLELFGLESKEWTSLFLRDCLEGEGDCDLRSFFLGRPKDHVHKMQRKMKRQHHASPRWFSWITCMIDDDDDALYFMSLQEITKSKMMETELKLATETAEAALEHAVQASKVKEAFFANMSHEIRTPLNGLVGMAALLKETDLNDLQRDYVALVEQSAESLGLLINDILDLSKLEANKVELVHEPFDLRQLIEDMVVLCASSIRGKALELTWSIDQRLPKMVLGDEARLRQVLNNLLSNAIKFTQEGEVSVRVNVRSQDHKALQVQFDVTDTGVGIDPEQIHRLFQPFTQVITATRQDTAGTGLGLAICKEFVELMGGDISAHSTLGRGSTFTFFLGLEIAEGAPCYPLVFEGLSSMKVALLSTQSSRFLNMLSLFEGANAEVTLHEDLHKFTTASCASHDIVFVDIQSFPFHLFLHQHQDALQDTMLVVLAPMGTNQVPLRSIGAVDDVLEYPLRHASLTRVLQERLKQMPQEIEEPLDTMTLKVDLYDMHWGEEEHGLFDFTSLVHEVAADPEEELDARHGFDTLEDYEVPQFLEADVNKESGHVLLVEDNHVNQVVATRLLEALGHQVTLAKDGLEAVERFEGEERFSLVLMDCQMPKLDGYGATQRIRQIEQSRGASRRTPVIALSAFAFQEEKQKAFDAGMDDYVCKPVTKAMLHDVWEKWALDDDSDLEESSENSRRLSEVNAIEEDRLMEIIESCGDNAFVRELLDTYEDSGHSFLKQFRQELLLVEQDHARLRHGVHSFKGASRSMGAKRLAEILDELESCAPTLSSRALDQYHVKVEQEFSRALSMIRWFVEHKISA